MQTIDDDGPTHPYTAKMNTNETIDVCGKEKTILKDIRRDLSQLLENIQNKIMEAHMLFVELATCVDPAVALSLEKASSECKKCAVSTVNGSC